MGFNFLLRIWAMVPKWLLVGLAACFFAYFIGVSHGRAPYKLAAKLAEATGKVIARQAQSNELIIDRKVKKAHENNQNTKYNFTANDSRILSDILE